MRSFLDNFRRPIRYQSNRRRRQAAHAKISFWLTWGASSIFLWLIVMRVLPPTAPNAPPINYAALIGVPPMSENGKQIAQWLGFGVADSERRR